MLQLYLGARAIILPINLALKIVFLYHKSGKQVNAYLAHSIFADGSNRFV